MKLHLLFTPLFFLSAAYAAPALTQGWIYPGNPACGAVQTYTLNSIDVLKPQYYTMSSTGTATLLTVASDGCNAYSAFNVSDVKAHSKEQYVTVSGDITSMRALFSTQAKQQAAINTWVKFLTDNALTGMELDWEGYSGWSKTDYTQFLAFTTSLGTALHAASKKLIIVGPAQTGQGSWLWNYGDFEKMPVDALAVMVYDYQWDYGAGTPISPNAWMKQVVAFTKTKISNVNRIIIGIPSYGYHGKTGGYDITIDTAEQSAKFPGYSTAVRDPNSYEMHWSNQGTSYFYQDQAGMNSKLALVQSLGVNQVSVWHLGGNPWFSGSAPTPSPTPTVTPTPSPSPTVTPTPPPSTKPTCTKTAGSVFVTGLASNVGCVMRTDTYADQKPVNGMVTFTNAQAVKSVELYTTLHGPQDCTGYLSELVCQ